MKYSIIPITCLLFTPLAFIAIPSTMPIGISVSPSYALDFAGGRPGYLDYKSDEITYFSFYTYFKRGIDPDCIDMVDESKTLVNDVQV